MATSTVTITALPDTAQKPTGAVVDARQRVADVAEFLAILALRLVWHGWKFYAVRRDVKK